MINLISDQLKFLKRVKPLGWFKGIVYTVLIAVVYSSALKELIWSDWSKPDYSHCSLIPFVTLYLIWDKRSQLTSVDLSPSWFGLIPLFLGLGLYWLGELGGEYFTMYLSMWFVVLGLLWLHLGWDKIKVLSFPLFILLAMFPFPNFINFKILLKLKLISSQIGVAILRMIGMSAYREGNVIDLGFTQLQVVDACSGMRYVLPLVFLSLILVYFFRAAIWKKAIVVISSIPIAVLVNSFRIALTGLLYKSWGPEVAEGLLHDFTGWMIFMITLPILFLEMWVLKKIGKEYIVGDITENNKQENITESKTLGANKYNRKIFVQPIFVVAVLLLTGTFALSHGIEFRENIPLYKSFNEFPLALGEWKGERQTIETKFLNVLNLSDYIMASYHNEQGQIVDFYVAFNSSQRKGVATHSPESCLPSSGWIFQKSSIQQIDMGNGVKIHVSRVMATNKGSQFMVYYWFPQRGRILTSLYQVKLYNFWDALTKKRTDGALVRIISEVYPNETIDMTNDRMISFIRAVKPLIDEYVPN